MRQIRVPPLFPGLGWGLDESLQTPHPQLGAGTGSWVTPVASAAVHHVLLATEDRKASPWGLVVTLTSQTRELGLGEGKCLTHRWKVTRSRFEPCLACLAWKSQLSSATLQL